MAKREITFRERLETDFEDDIDRTEKENIKAISTNALSLDVSTGIGGIPLGRLTEIYGPDGCGKTTLVLQVAKNALAQGMKVLYADLEGTLTMKYAHDIMGEFDEDNFILIHANIGERAMKIVEAGIRSLEFNLVIIDSVAAITIEKELEDELGDRHIGLLPTFLSSFLRRNILLCKKHDIGLIFINQVRAKIGGYIPTLETPGGWAMKHFTSLKIMITRGKDIKVNEMSVGNMINFVIKKNKLAPPFRSFVIPLYYGKGFNYLEDVIRFASDKGVIKRRGSYFVFEDETLGAGVAKAGAYLADKKDLLDKIEKECYNILDIGKINLDDGLEEVDGEPE